MDIYWIADKRQCGPATVPDVLSLVQMGELSPDTRGWHAGCEGWMPLRDLPALADFLKEEEEEPLPQEDLPPVPGAESAPAEPEMPQLPPGAVRVYLPTPVERLLARLADISLYMALFYGVIYARQIPFDVALLPSSPMVWLGYVLLEAVLVYFLGTTPGKAMLGMQVRCVGAGSMTIGRSLSRACLVFVGGLGMMISVLPLIMMVFSLVTLRKKGITMWDARCATLPLQMQPTKTMRRFLAVLVILIAFQLAGSCLVLWTEEMVAAVETQNPALAEWLRESLPAPESESAEK
ncbi:MAG: RDD family protein [Akkermansia sp.]|nr:RDD family protein [Akkermansia sp.]